MKEDYIDPRQYNVSLRIVDRFTRLHYLDRRTQQITLLEEHLRQQDQKDSDRVILDTIHRRRRYD